MTSTNTTQKNPEGSRAQVHEKLKLFMDDDNFKVLALKGKWGVGKTHLVENFFDEQKRDFYYGSVFGISSIEQLKSQILANKGVAGKIIKLINSQADKLAKMKGVSLPNLPTIAGSAISIGSDLLFNLAFNSINGFICIDDLERKSKLELIELLGFVENLIQEPNRKVILIFNEDELIKNEASQKALKEYREKVIDIEVELNPTVEENISFIFPENDPDSEFIKSIFITTKTNNIRVLTKFKWNLKQFQPLIQDWNSTIRLLIIRNIVIASLVRLDNNFQVEWEHLLSFTGHEEEIELIRSESQKKDISRQEEDQVIVKDKQAKTLLNDVKFNVHLLKSINKIIFYFIENCLLDKDKFICEGQALSDRENQDSPIEKLLNIFSLLSSSFKNSTQEIKDITIEFLDSYIADLDIDEFEKFKKELIDVYLPDLNVSKYQEILLKNVIEKSNVKNFRDVKRLENLQLKIENSPELEGLCKHKISEYYNTVNFPEEITRILEKRIKDGILTVEGILDIEFLNRLTKDNFIQWLEIDNPNFPILIRECLNLHEKASNTLKEAIKELAQKSELNARIASNLYKITLQ